MAKITWTFKNEEGTNLNRYIATNVSTGEKITFDLLRGGNISVVGTPLNAENLNALITSINACYDLITSSEKDTTYTLSKNGNAIRLTSSSGATYDVTLNKSDVGLSNVDNTSDKDKPISNATQQALDTKANASDVYTKSETYSKNETDNKTNKSLYNLGAFDTISGNVITRQTGYVDLGSLNWTHITQSGNDFYYTSDIQTYALKDSGIKVVAQYYEGVNQNTIYNLGAEQCSIDNDGLLQFRTSGGTPKGLAQYQLATSYTEEIIEGQPLITLDSQGSQWLRSEWEKGLNLLPTQYSNNFTISFDTYINYPISKGTYTIKPTNSGVNGTIIIKDINGIELYNDFWVNGLTFTINSDGCYIQRFWQKGTITTNIMLNEGSTPIPYQPYNGSIVREKQLDELNQVVSTNTNNISSLQTSVSANTSSISTNTSSISSLQTSLQTNTNNIATNTSNISSLQTSVSAINGKLLTYIDCTLDDNDDISCTFDTSVITKENAQNYAVKMKVYNSDSEQHNYQYLYFDKIKCYEPEGGGDIEHIIYYSNPNHTFLIERIINGSNATDVVAYENGYNVKKSIEAIYASSDHTKGTIEKRLTALGFKEGVMSLSGYTLTDSTAPNTVKKQGKYCIANLDVSMDSLKTYSITVPNDFKPKQATTFYAKGSAYVYAQLTHYVIEVTIDTSGVINLPASPNGFWSKIKIKNAGWELA